MGGDITATSRLGAGSTFVFTARLPAAPAAPDVPPVSEAVAPKPVTATVQGGEVTLTLAPKSVTVVAIR